jgi:hypothetical protein
MLTNKCCFLNFFSIIMLNSIQVLGEYGAIWGNMPFFFFSGGAEEGAQWGKCRKSSWYLKMP